MEAALVVGALVPGRVDGAEGVLVTFVGVEMD
jgi:hypothetical protein